jgi:hypothetical protein
MGVLTNTDDALTNTNGSLTNTDDGLTNTDDGLTNTNGRVGRLEKLQFCGMHIAVQGAGA